MKKEFRVGRKKIGTVGSPEPDIFFISPITKRWSTGNWNFSNANVDNCHIHVELSMPIFQFSQHGFLTRSNCVNGTPTVRLIDFLGLQL